MNKNKWIMVFLAGLVVCAALSVMIPFKHQEQFQTSVKDMPNNIYVENSFFEALQVYLALYIPGFITVFMCINGQIFLDSELSNMEEKTWKK